MAAGHASRLGACSPGKNRTAVRQNQLTVNIHERSSTHVPETLAELSFKRGDTIRDVAPAYAALRRSETKAFGPHVKPVPKSIRPAVAHYRLRKHYSEKGEPDAVTKRLGDLG